uniref:RING-CH-type domain-containing protein n=2 Tax=Populus trichocarpa TaxID=3694 RepID=A0A3N7EGV7_POPTR
MPATHTPHFDRVHFSASSSDISLSGEIGAHRNSSESDCLSEVDLESGALDMEVHSDNKTQRDCRICHLGLETSEQECGGAIELGCSCKGDLGAAHKKCAETWFKIKGNTKSEYPCDGFEELYIMVVRKCF